MLVAFGLAALAGWPSGALASDVVSRAGCSVRTEQVDADGVATVAAECRWPLDPSAVLATLRSPEKLGAALSSLGECRRLPDGRVLQVHEIGWPLEDRQVTLEWRETPLDGGGVRIDVLPAERQEPLPAGRTAIRESAGRWEIRPDGPHATRIHYTSRYDAGGSLEPWLVRRFQRAGVASSLAELRAAVASR